MVKFNKWALAFANTVAVFYTASAAALYIWGERAIDVVEKFHLVKMSNEMLALDVTPVNYAYGLVVHYIFAYIFVAMVIRIHDRMKGK